MRSIIIYRGKEFIEDELAAAEAAGFICTNSRLDVRPGDLVIPRYSALPYYRELESDVIRLGGRLINNYRQHLYIADMINWYEDLKGLTPETWTSVIDIPFSEDGPFVVKGQTNSKKFLFNSHMLALTREDLGPVIGRLLDDTLIGEQSLYIRKFEPFVTYMTGLHGLPITKEFRFFVFKDRVLSGGFYWSSHLESLLDLGRQEAEFDPGQVPDDFLQEVILKVGNKASGYCVDVARHSDGRWRVVELNDLQMSGLSENNPDVMYSNLMKRIQEYCNVDFST